VLELPTLQINTLYRNTTVAYSPKSQPWGSHTGSNTSTSMPQSGTNNKHDTTHTAQHTYSRTACTCRDKHHFLSHKPTHPSLQPQAYTLNPHPSATAKHCRAVLCCAVLCASLMPCVAWSRCSHGAQGSLALHQPPCAASLRPQSLAAGATRRGEHPAGHPGENAAAGMERPVPQGGEGRGGMG
jgi:hypothetical protein